jgi:photosystem II stability/assembly factor-like uncharacterized protein
VNDQPLIVIRIGRRALVYSALGLALLLAVLFVPSVIEAQKVQESYGEKFSLTESASGVGIATSADGKFVYVVGTRGVLVSDDHGKTGSWVQTVRMK